MNALTMTTSTERNRKHGFLERNPSPSTPTPRSRFSLGGIAQALGKTTLSLALILLVLFLAVWYSTPYFVRDYINKKGEDLPDYAFHSNWVRIHPWNCSIDVEDVHLVKKGDKIPVPFFACPRVHVATQWSEVLHLTLRSRIDLIQPVVNFVEGPTEETSQVVLEPEWVTRVKQMVPLRINRFTIWEGVLHYYDFHANPQIDMEMDDLNLSLDNLTNSTRSSALMPSTAVITGRPFKVGWFEARLALNVDLKQPTFAEKVKIEKIPAPALNAFLAKYGSVYAKSGQLAVYTEMVSANGDFNGYVKPFFQNLQFEPVPKDRDGLAAIWASLVNGVKDIFENDDNKAVATKVPISGHYQDPNVDFWAAAFGVVKNAFLQTLSNDFDHPEITPAPEKQSISDKALDRAVNQGQVDKTDLQKKAEAVKNNPRP
jgi:hypothetical protein